MSEIFRRIEEFLEKNNIPYQLKTHPPTRTSEESALHRGEPLKIGAKAMVTDTDNAFIMAVLPADRKIDSNYSLQRNSLLLHGRPGYLSGHTVLYRFL